MTTLEQWAEEFPSAMAVAVRRPAVALRAMRDRLVQQIDRRAHPSVADRTRVVALDGELSVTSTAPQAGILETGGTILGRPWLAVPIGTAQGLAGPRLDPLARFSFRSRDGRVFLGAKIGGHLLARWRLVHQITIRPEPWLGPSLEAVLPAAAEELADDVAQILIGAS